MQVLNRHHFHGKSWPPTAVYVGRGTALGNPFQVGAGGMDREDAVAAYRSWLIQKIQHRDPIVLTALAGLKDDSSLVCSCAPAPCHADVIREVWATWHDAGGIDPRLRQALHRDGGVPQRGECFVFGSNEGARHGKGAAAVARDQFGASPSVHEGYAGHAPRHCYAIPTKDAHLQPLPLGKIQDAVNRFIAHATITPDIRYFVTRVGCGLAGFEDSVIAPLFSAAPGNCSFAEAWERFLPHPPRPPTQRYAGIGSRKAPSTVTARMTRIAQRLEARGFTLLTGDAEGSDAAFAAGATAKEVYRPPFRCSTDNAPANFDEASRIAKAVHPLFDRLSEIARQLLARNSYQVLGKDLRSPVDFVVCWTPDGVESEAERTASTGGTGQAIALASRWQVPVFNLAREDALARLARHLNHLSIAAAAD